MSDGNYYESEGRRRIPRLNLGLNYNGWEKDPILPIKAALECLVLDAPPEYDFELAIWYGDNEKHGDWRRLQIQVFPAGEILTPVLNVSQILLYDGEKCEHSEWYLRFVAATPDDRARMILAEIQAAAGRKQDRLDDTARRARAAARNWQGARKAHPDLFDIEALKSESS